MINPTARGLLTGVIVELTAATAYLHFSLGGTLFLLNAAGYVALGAAYAISAVAPIPIVRRFSWLPRLGLAAYTLVTIGAYLLMGPYFALGWIAKGIELAIIGLVLADLLVTYGSPASLIRAAEESFAPPPSRRGT
ncbi:MAG: hypothetical protein ACRDGV_07215 [Candidatus Limnocylindria bacterium]